MILVFFFLLGGFLLAPFLISDWGDSGILDTMIYQIVYMLLAGVLFEGVIAKLICYRQ